MFKGEFKFNLRNALGLNDMMYFPQYEQAYCITNEPIAEWLKLTPIAHPRVLSVAASGDQPLLYAATGASHIDTFDMTLNACVIMDFKTTALGLLSYPQYMDTVDSLRHLDMMGAPKDVIRVTDNMPDRTRELMQNIIKLRPTVFQRDMYDDTVFPSNETTYQEMQHAAQKPFNFIWANLAHVHHYIDGKYDIINTSNIFEHYLGNGKLPVDIKETIESMWPHLNVGGYILCTTIYPTVPQALKHFQETWDKIGAKITIHPYIDKRWKPVLIQKTR